MRRVFKKLFKRGDDEYSGSSQFEDDIIDQWDHGARRPPNDEERAKLEAIIGKTRALKSGKKVDYQQMTGASEDEVFDEIIGQFKSTDESVKATEETAETNPVETTADSEDTQNLSDFFSEETLQKAGAVPIAEDVSESDSPTDESDLDETGAESEAENPPEEALTETPKSVESVDSEGEESVEKMTLEATDHSSKESVTDLSAADSKPAHELSDVSLEDVSLEDVSLEDVTLEDVNLSEVDLNSAAKTKASDHELADGESDSEENIPEADDMSIDAVEMDDIEVDDMDADAVEMDDIEVDDMDADAVEMDDIEVDDMDADSIEMDDIEIDDMDAEAVEMDDIEVDDMGADAIEMDDIEVDDMDADAVDRDAVEFVDDETTANVSQTDNAIENDLVDTDIEKPQYTDANSLAEYADEQIRQSESEFEQVIEKIMNAINKPIATLENPSSSKLEMLDALSEIHTIAAAEEMTYLAHLTDQLKQLLELYSPENVHERYPEVLKLNEYIQVEEQVLEWTNRIATDIRKANATQSERLNAEQLRADNEELIQRRVKKIKRGERKVIRQS